MHGDILRWTGRAQIAGSLFRILINTALTPLFSRVTYAESAASAAFLCD